MKTKTNVALLFSTLILVACTSTTTVAAPTNDFSFEFQYTPCGLTPLYVLNTTTNTLVNTPLGEQTSTTISLPLKDDELESIEQKADSIGFFQYPAEFVIPENEVLAYVSGTSVYELSLTKGDVTHSVLWKDHAMTKPEYTEADQLRELMRLIIEIIRSHPEFQRLPSPSAACA